MKNIFNTFNRVEIDLEDYDNASLSNEEIEKIKNRVSKKLNKKKKSNYRELIIAVGFCVAFLLFLNNDIVSANIDIFNKNFKEIFKVSENKDYTDYTTVIGKTIVDKNISVTLEEVLLDNNQLIVSTMIDYTKVSKRTKDKMFKDIKSANNYQKITINEKEYRPSSATSYPISDNEIRYISFIDIDKITDKTILNCEVSYEFYTVKPFDSKNSYLDKKIKGNWEFKFNINTLNIPNNVKTIYFTENNKLELKNGDLVTINKVEKSDLSIKFYYDLVTSLGRPAYPIEIIDSNEKYHYPISYNNSYAQFLITDNLKDDTFIISGLNLSNQEIKVIKFDD